MTEETPHEADVEWLFESGISTGWLESDGTRTFRPTNTVLRQDMAAFLYRLAGSPEYTPTDEDVNRFTDVTAATPHAIEIWWLASTGISTGWSDGTFRPTNTVIRQDMAAFLHRLSGDTDYVATEEDMARFADVDETTPHANDIWWLASAGVSRGWAEDDGTSTFRPTNKTIRQDMAAFLHRMQTEVGYEASATHEYLFAADGSVVTGWVEVDGEQRFYDTTNGARVNSGWAKESSTTWRYIDPETKELLTDGLYVINGSSYLFDEEGVAAVGWVELEDGARFFNRSTKVMLCGGIFKADGSTYCFADDGTLQYGWQEVSGAKYYFDPTSGVMRTGWQTIDGSKYYFKSSGVMQTGWLTLSGSTYYLDADTGALHLGWLTLDGSTYYLDSSTGKLFKGGTFIIDGGAYRIAANGKVYSSLTGTNNSKLDDYISWIIVNKCKATGETGLRAAYDYIRSCPYISSSHTYDTNWENWGATFALQFKEWGGGNCYRYAATMTYTAIALGYNAIARTGLCNNVNDHGWCEITTASGTHLVIDCSLGNSHAYPNINWFLIKYEQARVAYYTLDHVCLDYY